VIHNVDRDRFHFVAREARAEVSNFVFRQQLRAIRLVNAFG